MAAFERIMFFLLIVVFGGLFLYGGYRAVFQNGSTALITYSIILGLVTFFIVSNFILNKSGDTIVKVLPIIIVLGAFFVMGKFGLIPGVSFSLLEADISLLGSSAGISLNLVGLLAVIFGIVMLRKRL